MLGDEMSEQDDGGQAFPSDSESIHPRHGGMSLRDYFAAKAFPAVHAACVEAIRIGGDPATFGKITIECYRYADAMLQARRQ